MLTKRTNILFDEKTFKYLSVLAQKNKTSVGDLIRKAVMKIYINNSNAGKLQAHRDILQLRKSIKKPLTLKEIKESINYGRKY